MCVGSIGNGRVARNGREKLVSMGRSGECAGEMVGPNAVCSIRLCTLKVLQTDLKLENVGNLLYNR